MTDNEIRIVTRICMGADGNCLYCAGTLVQMLVEHFPEHTSTIREEWETDEEGDPTHWTWPP